MSAKKLSLGDIGTWDGRVGKYLIDKRAGDQVCGYCDEAEVVYTYKAKGSRSKPFEESSLRHGCLKGLPTCQACAAEFNSGRITAVGAQHEQRQHEAGVALHESKPLKQFKKQRRQK